MPIVFSVTAPPLSQDAQRSQPIRIVAFKELTPTEVSDAAGKQGSKPSIVWICRGAHDVVCEHTLLLILNKTPTPTTWNQNYCQHKLVAQLAKEQLQ